MKKPVYVCLLCGAYIKDDTKISDEDADALIDCELRIRGPKSMPHIQLPKQIRHDALRPYSAGGHIGIAVFAGFLDVGD